VEEEKKDVEKPAEAPKAKPKPKKALAERIEEREVRCFQLFKLQCYFLSCTILLIFTCKNSEESKGGSWEESKGKGGGTYTRRKASRNIEASEVARGGGLTTGDGNFWFVDSSRL